MPGLCQFVLHFLVTSDTSPINYDALRIFLGHYPSGSGINCLIHYIQMHTANKFQEFDHGTSKNLKLYNSSTPPIIDTKNMIKSKVPIALYVGKDDMMVNIAD